MTKILNQSEFDAVAAIYGANVKNWPADRQAEGFLALEAGLKAASDEALLDTRLAEAFAVSPPSDLLSRRILKAAQSSQSSGMSRAANENVATRHTAVMAGTKPKARKWRFASIAAVILFAIGFSVYPNITPSHQADEMWVEAATELGIDDIYEWVQSEDI